MGSGSDHDEVVNMKRDLRFESPSTYAGYLEATGRIAGPDAPESVWLPEDHLVGVYRCLQDADSRTAGQSRAREFLEMLAGELHRMERAATSSGDVSILYSHQYTSVTTAVRRISAGRRS